MALLLILKIYAEYAKPDGTADCPMGKAAPRMCRPDQTMREAKAWAAKISMKKAWNMISPLK